MSNYWNSTFQIREGRTPLRSSKQMKKNGRRTNDWLRVWRWLRPRLEAADRTRCEFSFIKHECFGALFPCHSKKRRLMRGPDVFAIAMGCQQIARYLDESLTHEQMEVAVMRAIEEHGGLILPDRY